MTDLTIPTFLIRHTPRLTNEEAHQLAEETGGVRRDWWMPGRDWKSSRESMAEIMSRYNTVAYPDQPVSVRVPSKAGKGTDEVARYANWATYEAGHDPAYVPRGQPQVVEGVTVVLCTSKPWAGKKPAPAAGPKRPSAKARLIGNMLLKGGVTSKELCEAVGWPTMSVPAQAKAVRLQLRKEKVDGVMKYWGTRE